MNLQLGTPSMLQTQLVADLASEMPEKVFPMAEHGRHHENMPVTQTHLGPSLHSAILLRMAPMKATGFDYLPEF